MKTVSMTWYLKGFCLNKITDHVFSSYEKPSNYDFLLSLQKVAHDIDYQRLNIDLSSMDKRVYDFKTRQIRNKINSRPPYIKYNIFGTKTGRHLNIGKRVPLRVEASEQLVC